VQALAPAHSAGTRECLDGRLEASSGVAPVTGAADDGSRAGACFCDGDRGETLQRPIDILQAGTGVGKSAAYAVVGIATATMRSSFSPALPAARCEHLNTANSRSSRRAMRWDRHGPTSCRHREGTHPLSREFRQQGSACFSGADAAFARSRDATITWRSTNAASQQQGQASSKSVPSPSWLVRPRCEQTAVDPSHSAIQRHMLTAADYLRRSRHFCLSRQLCVGYDGSPCTPANVIPRGQSSSP
jgi:hypothetical protein